MSNRIKDIHIKNHKYYLFDDIYSIKGFDQKNRWKIMQKYSYSPPCICGDQKFLLKISLVSTNEGNEKIKNMKNSGLKSEI